jgi:hypothetical protein
VSYHADFWITIGAATPVLALGHMVSVASAGPDAIDTAMRLHDGATDGAELPVRVLLRAIVGPALSSVGVALALMAFNSALGALTSEADGKGWLGLGAAQGYALVSMSLVFYAYIVGLFAGLRRRTGKHRPHP